MAAVAQPAREAVVRSGAARLYVRDVGRGHPIVVVHGGPDFDHEYLLPELDRLADSVRLVYYDQRGRGRSFHGDLPHEVTMTNEVQDLDAVRRWIGAGPVGVLGHSWGALVALEYAIRHPARVSHLVLMNTSPCSHAGALVVRRELEGRRSPEQARMMTEIVSSPRYLAGDLDADLEYYRIHFASALYRTDRLEELLRRLRVGFTAEGVVRAREIEARLYEQTWSSDSYDLVPQLRRLRIPTLIIHGEHDFIDVGIAENLAASIPAAQLIVLPRCGHFAYLEQPEQVRRHLAAFLAAN